MTVIEVVRYLEGNLTLAAVLDCKHVVLETSCNKSLEKGEVHLMLE